MPVGLMLMALSLHSTMFFVTITFLTRRLELWAIWPVELDPNGSLMKKGDLNIILELVSLGWEYIGSCFKDSIKTSILTMLLVLIGLRRCARVLACGLALFVLTEK
jgi:hypothetical protein